ncbi:hypothetical protein N7481_008113 [Penicillium waksmanii]|uniref:uncharacterized protein n=1 Tax=Penicillium waksmanii TaxID=69791 RepID=UPI0025486999|nr:uncharacterized protein N7481_008113 [Penicillium waksmanii]KAJ5980815.1 hypothetical protein N7481_008113 [Penicillium waksmanii]
MSATTTTLMTTTLVGTSSAMTKDPFLENSCPTCGSNGGLDASEAQRRILELEGQIQEMTAHSAIAAGKLADYEEELRKLRSQPTYDTPRSSSSVPPSSSHGDKSLSPSQTPASLDNQSQQPQQPQPVQQSRLTTLTNLLPYRRGSSTPTSASAPVPSTPTAPITPLPQTASPASSDNAELQDALEREQGLRKAAEKQLTQANTELEDLTVQLFSQANEMVAQERKARAKLEERVAVLERRDIEKRSRLERLEKAMARVERVKALVRPSSS